MIVFLGKLFMAGVWALMFINLVHPFTTPANIFINGALVFFVVTHGLQTWLLSKTLTDKERKSGNLCLKLFFFGIFEAISWQKEK